MAKACVKSFLKNYGFSFANILDKSNILESLSKVPIFKSLTRKKLESVSHSIKLKNFPSGTSIITEGEEGETLFIIKTGQIDISVKGSYIRTLGPNQCLGERALLIKEPRSATAVANGSVSCYSLDNEDFIAILEDNMKEYLLNRLNLQDNSVELKDLDYYSDLGSGNYGTVNLVQSKKNNYFYAIKSIPKTQLDAEQLHENLTLERSILLQIDHPFIVKLVKNLKDSNYIYFLMEYIKGKELFDVIRDIGLLSKVQTQFYSGSLILSVEYLHSRKFIFRDIKPENVIVTETGFIKLIDFGTAKSIQERTATIIGTPHYMAPEVILGEGYTFSVDYWSIGNCFKKQ